VVYFGKFVWAAVGATIVRVDPKTKRMVDWFEGHSGPIDDLILYGDFLWSCSSADCSIRLWKTNVPVAKYVGECCGVCRDLKIILQA
jgi:hypothetical protein